MRIDDVAGVRVVHHGGSLLGYQSDWFALPEAGVGAVLLMNSDAGHDLRAAFMRRLVEIVYGARPLAYNQLIAAAARRRILAKVAAAHVKTSAAAAAAQLASSYVEPSLGWLDVERTGANVKFRFATLASVMGATTASNAAEEFVAIDPGMSDFRFAAGGEAGHRTLTISDGQHD